MTLSQRLNRFPPLLCRYYAHEFERPLSYREIAQRSGLTRGTVYNVSNSRTWDRWPLEVIERFSAACGVNLMKTYDARRALRRLKLAYLENAQPQARRMYRRLLSELGSTPARPAAEGSVETPIPRPSRR